MKIIRYFIQHTSDESGINGWCPLWVPKSAEFDPMNALGMAHDMFEHSLGDRGHLHEEAQAFGRIVAFRLIPGLLNGYGNQTDRLGEEFAGIWGRTEKIDIAKPPRTAPLGCAQTEQTLVSLMRACMKSIVTEMSDNHHWDHWKKDNGLHKNAGAYFLSWLRIGYRDALRRYGQQDHEIWDIASEVKRWATSNTARLNNLAESEEIFPGSVLRLCFETETREMKDRLYERNFRTELFPDWLERRVNAWKFDIV